MILLTNSAEQTVEPGASVTFDTVAIKTGCGECHRDGSSSVTLRLCGTYEAAFSANLGGVAAGAVSLSLNVDGDPLGQMDTVTAAAGDLASVSYTTAVRNCTDGSSRITVTNNGAAAVTVTSPSLLVRRVS